MKDIYNVIKKPCLTEKAMLLQETTNQVVLKVDPRANIVEQGRLFLLPDEVHPFQRERRC